MYRPCYLTLSISMALAVAVSGCGKKEAAGEPRSQAAAPSANEKPQPYTYPAPVKGHYKEINTGDFDLADGIAYPAGRGGGTVVWVTAKAIASPVLAGSECPMTEARALSALRDSPWVEVTLDSAGHSPYFSAGAPYGGTGREEDVGGGYWRSTLTNAGADRIAGSVTYRNRGGIEFDLPVSRPGGIQISEGERVQGHRSDTTARTPAAAEITAAYQAVLKAALAKDLHGILAAQGFDAKQITAIRGLAGIEADLPAFADRFLTPGSAESASGEPGQGGIMGHGTNSKGEKFSNWYQFTPCGKRLVLTGIGLNPQ